MMKAYTLYHSVHIPEDKVDDVRALQQFIKDNLDVDISFVDTYLFWTRVSESWCAGWLSITAHYDDETREESLLWWLRKYGTIEGDNED